MRFSRVLLMIIFVTSLCLVYVYQQTQIFCLGYKGEKCSETYQDLLDKNNLLRYNINVVTSLPFMGTRVLEAAEFEMPAVSKVVRLQAPQEKTTGVSRLAKVLSIFSIKSEAEAGTTSP